MGSGGDGGFSNGFRKPKFTDIVNEYMGVCFEEHCTIGESSDEAASLVGTFITIHRFGLKRQKLLSHVEARI